MASSSSAAVFLGDAAAPDQEAMQANMRNFLQLTEERPAGPRANKQTPTWLIDALTNILEPSADTDPDERFSRHHPGQSVARAPI